MTEMNTTIIFENVEITPAIAAGVEKYLEAAGLEITHPYVWASGSHDMWDQKWYCRYRLERKGGGSATPGDWTGLKLILGIDPGHLISEEVFWDLEDYIDISEYEEDD